jgi:pimeloyl-ACP methyl ester carboxylesterase
VITAALDGLDDVIVVGHSLGGLPAAHVATMRPTRHLVYLTPGFPLPGYSLAEAMEEDPYTDDPVLDVSEDIGGGLIRFPAEYGDLFYNACTYTESKDAASKLRLQAAKPITEKCTIVSYPDVPTTVILASLDRVLDLNRMSAITRKRFGLEPVVLRSDHSPFLSMPDRLADRLMELV